MSRDVEWPEMTRQRSGGAFSFAAITTGLIGLGVSLPTDSAVTTACSIAVLTLGAYWYYGRGARKR
jgi:hypothetical protein